MQAFDHFVLTAATLDDGAAHVARHLGHVVGPGGEHARMGTHNRLSGLGTGEYMEVIAVDPDAPAPDGPRWFDLDCRTGAPRLGNWVLRTDDLDGLVARFPQAGRVLDFARGDYRWRMAVPEDGVLPFDGCFPALIEWESDAPVFADAGLRLTGLTLRHPEAEALRGIIAELSDDPRIAVMVGKRRIEAVLDTPDGPHRIS